MRRRHGALTFLDFDGFHSSSIVQTIEIKKSSMNLDRGPHLASVWNLVFDLTWPLITYFVVAHLGPCHSCFFTIYLKPQLSYIRPLLSLLLLFLTNHTLTSVTSVFVPQPIIVFTLFTHAFVTSPLCNHMNSLLSQHFSTCKQLTKTLGSKSPAVDWLIVVYCSSVNLVTISMQLWASAVSSTDNLQFWCHRLSWRFKMKQMEWTVRRMVQPFHLNENGMKRNNNVILQHTAYSFSLPNAMHLRRLLIHQQCCLN